LTARKRKRSRAAAPDAARVPPRATGAPIAHVSAASRRLAAAALGIAVLAIYVRTLAPDVAGGDSGELITVAHTLGVAHPPGYPLYTLLAKLFTLLPLGTIAWRVNLFSAVCGAGAATVLFLAIARWSGSLWAAMASASLFAFSPRVWPHAVTAEVFALNNFFLAGLVYLTVRFWQDGAGLGGPRPAQACLVFFWIGLGLSNHHTLIFYAVPAALFVLIYGGPELRRPRRLVMFAGCGLTGLLPYAYLPIASARVPLMSWGDQTTVQGFLDHFFRREYGTFRLGIQEQGPRGVLMQRLGIYTSGSFADLFWVGPFLAVAGVFHALRQRAQGLAWCWAGAFLFFVIVFNNLANGSLEPGVARFVEGRFWQQPHLLLCVFAGLGLAGLSARLGPTARFVLPAVAVSLAIAQPAIHFREQDKSGQTEIRDFLKAILVSQPEHSLLLETGDYIFHGLRYMQIVEGYRTDIRVLDQMLLGYPWHQRLATKYFPDVTFPGSRMLPRIERAGDYGMKAFFDANHERLPIYVCDVSLWEDARAAYTPWPSGLVDRVMPNPNEPAPADWIESTRSSFGRVNIEALRRHPADSWEQVALKYYWKQMGKHALSLARWGGQHDEDRAALTHAAELMEGMLARWPEAPHELHRDLGVVYQQLARYDPSLLTRMRREFEMYLTDAPATDPSVPMIRQILEQTR
jgi:hypothetical protein